MDTKQPLEKLRQFLITHELPKTDVAFFGVQCPYCGKSDRIIELEPPEELTDKIDPEKINTYTTLWKLFNSSKTVLGICKFCLNPVRLILEENQARTLYS